MRPRVVTREDLAEIVETATQAIHTCGEKCVACTAEWNAREYFWNSQIVAVEDGSWWAEERVRMQAEIDRLEYNLRVANEFVDGFRGQSQRRAALIEHLGFDSNV